jgi:hypothetical protein
MMSRCNFWTEIRPLRRQIESPKRRFWPLIKEVRKGGGGWKMGKEKKKMGGGGGRLPPPCLPRISLGDVFWRREKRAFVFFRYRKLIFIIDKIKLNIE